MKTAGNVSRGVAETAEKSKTWRTVPDKKTTKSGTERSEVGSGMKWHDLARFQDFFALEHQRQTGRRREPCRYNINNINILHWQLYKVVFGIIQSFLEKPKERGARRLRPSVMDGAQAKMM
jgi:hypothetical protein